MERILVMCGHSERRKEQPLLGLPVGGNWLRLGGKRNRLQVKAARVGGLYRRQGAKSERNLGAIIYPCHDRKHRQKGGGKRKIIKWEERRISRSTTVKNQPEEAAAGDKNLASA